MFKMIFFTMLFFNVAVGQAQASSETIAYTGQTESQSQLSSAQHHTEYTYERVWTTCSRQVADGYERICHNTIRRSVIEKRRICQMIDGRAVCTDDGGGSTGGGGNDDDDDYDNHTTTHCYDRQTYRTEYYSCEEVVAHPYSVFDFATDASVAVKFGAWPLNTAPSKSSITVDLSNAGALSADAQSAGATPVFVYGAWTDEVRQGAGQARKVSSTLNVSFQNAEKVLAPLQAVVTDIALEGQELSFTVAQGSWGKDYEIAITAKKVRWFLLKDREIVKTTLSASHFKVQEVGNKWRISIPLMSLAKFEVTKKYRFELSLGLASGLKNNLLNTQQLPATKARAEFKGRFQ